MGGRWSYAFYVLTFLLSLAATSYVSYRVYRHMPHLEDEISQCFQAKIFASGRLWCPEPRHPEFFKKIDSLIFYQGRIFSQYPYAHSAMLALGYLAGLPWLIPPIASSLSIVVIVLMYRELYGSRAAWLIPLLALSSPFYLFLAGSYMNHTTCLLFTSLSLYMIVRAARQKRRRQYALAAIFLGLAFCTRPLSAALISLPFVLFLFADAFRGTPRGPSGAAIFLTVLIAACCTLPLYNFLMIGSFTDPITTIHENELHKGKTLPGSYSAIGFGRGVGSFGGHSLQRALYNTNVNLGNLMIHLYGWPVFFTLAFMAVPFITRRRTGWDRLCLASAVSLPAGYFFYFHYGYGFGPRYWFESLPFLLILTARGIDELASLCDTGRINPAYPRPCVYALVGFLICGNLFSWVPGLPDNVPYPSFYLSFRPVFRELIKEKAIHNAVVFVRQREIDNYDFMTAFELNAPDLRGDVVFARDLGPEKNKILMQDHPGRNYFIGDWTEGTLHPIEAHVE